MRLNMPKKLIKLIITIVFIAIGIKTVMWHLKSNKLGYDTWNSMIYIFIILGLVLTYILTRSDTRKEPVEKVSDGFESQLINKVKEGNIEACKQLLDESVDVNQQDEKGATALIYAVLNIDVAMVALLISQGADISIVTNKGLTANTIAKNNNMTNILKILNNNHTP